MYHDYYISAIYLDEKKAPNRSQRSTIFMYTAAGREMAAVKVPVFIIYSYKSHATVQYKSCVGSLWSCQYIFQWGRASPIIQLGWSSNEDLLCIQDDGSILVYDIFGVYQRTFSMGQVGSVWYILLISRYFIILCTLDI